MKVVAKLTWRSTCTYIQFTIGFNRRRQENSAIIGAFTGGGDK